MSSVKRFYKKILFESEISSYDIDRIIDVKVDNAKDSIEFKIELVDGRTPTLNVSYENFIKWAVENHGNYTDMFKEFVAGFLSTSDTVDEQPIKEIVDDNGDIMPDEDLPTNADDSMIGTSNHMDTSAIANQVVPPHGNRYFGTYGSGFVVW